MKNTKAVLSVKFHSSHPQEELLQICHQDLEVFKDVTGLIEKFYLLEEHTGAISGIYQFETKSALSAFWTSELATSIPERYAVIPESLRVEKYDLAIELSQTVVRA